jgi:AraC-like DNA-binding protein
MDKKRIEDFIFGLNCKITVCPPFDCLHRHNEIEMSFFTARKPVMFRIGGQVITLDRDSTLLFWATIPHQIIAIEKGAKHYYITIPPHTFLSWDLPASLTRGILNGSVFVERDKNLRRMDIASFPVWAEEAADTPNLQRHIALNRSMEARIRRFGGAAQSASVSLTEKSGFPVHASAKVNRVYLRMVDYITNNFKEAIKIDDIAKEAGIHPNYAISLFHKEGGINITNYILMLRIYESQRLLLTSDMKIVDIAMEAGFGSMSNFYKYFKKICGKKPKDYRKILGT